MCPLCGLHHSIGKYEPDDLPLDIEAIVKVGLGRGLGTKVVDRYSILGDDDVTPKVVSRVLVLCGLFLRRKIVTMDDLKNSLGVENFPWIIDVKEYNRLREDSEALKVNLEFEKRVANNEKIRADNLLSIVNSQRGNIRDNNRLREDVEALKVRVESEERKADRESKRANSLQATVNSLNGKVRDLETQLSNSESSRSRQSKEVEELEARVEDLNDALDDVVETIEERTNYVHDPSEDSRKDFIMSVITRLIEDVEALKADEEE